MTAQCKPSNVMNARFQNIKKIQTRAGPLNLRRAPFIDAVNQGNWSLSIKLRLVYFVIAKKCKHYAKALTYSQNDSKIQGCLRCQL